MKILENKTSDNILTTKILIEADEFDAALEQAYQENNYKFTESGREEVERIFGPRVLYDEALDICIPKFYLEFIHKQCITPLEQPEIVDISWLENGCPTFTIQVAIRPKVSPEQYKGIVVRVPTDNQVAFTEAVICEAAGNIEVLMPETMINQKLNALLAEQKMQICQDPIYNVLADMVEILKKAYSATGISRSMAQVRSEAMDIMLQTMSKDQKEPTKEHLYFLLKETVKGYRELPAGFDEKLDIILEERKQSTLAMTSDEKIKETFSAYLGSLDLSEEVWLEENRNKAIIHAKFDLLLDAVGEAEEIGITADELVDAFMNIGKQCGIDLEEVKASVDRELLEWQLKRDKAKKLILDSAVTNV